MRAPLRAVLVVASIGLLAPGAARADSLLLGSLPAGVPMLAPAPTPPHIGAKEKVEGLSFTGGHGGDPLEVRGDAPGTCLAPRIGTEVTGIFSDRQVLFDGGGVVGLRAERLEVEGGKATLDVLDVVIDAHTHGARTVGDAKLPLREIAHGPGKLRVYATRLGEDVHLVVDGANGSSTVRLTDGRALGTTCSHVHVKLAEKGPTVAVRARVELPAPREEGPFAERLPPGATAGTVIRDVRVTASLSRVAKDPETRLAVTIGRDVVSDSIGLSQLGETTFIE